VKRGGGDSGGSPAASEAQLLATTNKSAELKRIAEMAKREAVASAEACDALDQRVTQLESALDEERAQRLDNAAAAKRAAEAQLKAQLSAALEETVAKAVKVAVASAVAEKPVAAASTGGGYVSEAVFNAALAKLRHDFASVAAGDASARPSAATLETSGGSATAELEKRLAILEEVTKQGAFGQR